MIKTENILKSFAEKILSDRFFADIQITHAYPSLIKPTFLKNAVVAYGIKGIELEDHSLGESIKAGTFSIFTDIFVPFSFDRATPEKIVFRICRDTADFNLVSISISEISADSICECYVMKAVFTFNNELSFRGDEDE